MRKNESEIFDKTRNQTFPTKMLEKKVENIAGNRPKNVVDFYFPPSSPASVGGTKSFQFREKRGNRQISRSTISQCPRTLPNSKQAQSSRRLKIPDFSKNPKILDGLSAITLLSLSWRLTCTLHGRDFPHCNTKPRHSVKLHSLKWIYIHRKRYSVCRSS